MILPALPPRFIVVEGLDGAGTTTQTFLLAERLRAAGVAVTTTREPTDGPVGRTIRQTLRRDPGAPAVHTLPWLFAADRADHLAREVEPELALGRWVISDRYYHSSLAYQSLTLPMEQVHALNATFRAPDLTLFLDVSVETCLLRIGDLPTKEIFEERRQLEAICGSYERTRHFLTARGERIVAVNGAMEVEAVTEALMRQVEWRWSPSVAERGGAA